MPKPEVEIGAPDITPYRWGSAGIPYVTTFNSGRDGPHVVINALTHGNELCGAWALRFLFEHGVGPSRGRLTLSFANTAAYERFDPERPRASRYIDEDFNRLWDPSTLDGDRRSCELDRARQLRPLIDDADLLLDVHSMRQPAPPLLLCGTTEKSRRLAKMMGYPATVVADKGHRRGAQMRDYGAFGDPASPRTAMLVECGRHWTRASVDVAIATCLRFLRASGVIEHELLGRLQPEVQQEEQRVIEVSDTVTVKDGPFRFVDGFHGLEVIPKAGTVIAYDGREPIRTPYDDCVLVMPSPRPPARGRTAVRLGRPVAS